MAETGELTKENDIQNPLGTDNVTKLMLKFAIPSIIAMMVSALYNIVDQLFIGHSVRPLGNAATNIAFPFTTSCMAFALLFGIGGASCYNLAQGMGKKDKAPYYICNSAACLFICGLIIQIISLIFLKPVLKLFGSPEDVMPYAVDYVSITAFGFPFLLLSSGGGHLVRADGAPKITMVCNLTGAIINTILDALFIFGFNMGMKGAALATDIGQVASAVIVIIYMFHFKTAKLHLKYFIPKFKIIGKVFSIGMASFFNQLAIMLVQVAMNNSMKFYGAKTEFGEAIPIAASGIIMKINMLVFSIVIGLAQGTQPIESYNYGAGNYKRVKSAYKLAAFWGTVISFIAFIVFQIFPKQIISLFGTGSAEYFKFGVKFMRVFLFFMWINALQPVTATFFTSIGKAGKGMFLSLTRQILFFLPLLLILPLFFGIDGCIYTGPTADFLAAIVTIIMAAHEFKLMNKQKKEKNA